MLYIVATPIGNLEDITLRALKALKEADLILTEDTRKAGFLLKHYDISKKPFLSFYEHNEDKRIPQVLEQLKQNKTVVLITSAGTPLISDPGFKLVRECIEENIPFTSIPGASSVINSLVLSGMPSDNFLFLGFLPRKHGKRLKKIQNLKGYNFTTIFFESAQRLPRTLLEFRQTLGERQCCVCRETTKYYEEIIRGSLSQVIRHVSGRKLKGECTIVLKGQE